MEFEVKVNGVVKKINMKEPLVRHQEQYFELLSDIHEGKTGRIKDLNKFRNELIVELSDNEITIDEVKSMSVKERNKILSVIEKQLVTLPETEKEKELKNSQNQ